MKKNDFIRYIKGNNLYQIEDYKEPYYYLKRINEDGSVCLYTRRYSKKTIESYFILDKAHILKKIVAKL